jgi:hypothetical protein
MPNDIVIFIENDAFITDHKVLLGQTLIRPLSTLLRHPTQAIYLWIQQRIWRLSITVVPIPIPGRIKSEKKSNSAPGTAPKRAIPDSIRFRYEKNGENREKVTR